MRPGSTRWQCYRQVRGTPAAPRRSPPRVADAASWRPGRAACRQHGGDRRDVCAAADRNHRDQIGSANSVAPDRFFQDGHETVQRIADRVVKLVAGESDVAVGQCGHRARRELLLGASASGPQPAQRVDRRSAGRIDRIAARRIGQHGPQTAPDRSGRRRSRDTERWRPAADTRRRHRPR